MIRRDEGGRLREKLRKAKLKNLKFRDEKEEKLENLFSFVIAK
jgi:hypothetical protein